MAQGDWLLFLHPETALEPGWEVEAESFISQAVMERPRAAVVPFRAGGFRRRGPPRRSQGRSAQPRCSALPYGDQGLLIPKRLYQKIGGYRALADMEDADLVRRIGRRRLVRLRARAVNIARPHQSALARRWR